MSTEEDQTATRPDSRDEEGEQALEPEKNRAIGMGPPVDSEAVSVLRGREGAEQRWPVN